MAARGSQAWFTGSLHGSHRGHTARGDTPSVRPRLILGCLLFDFIGLLAAASVGAAAKPEGRYAQADGTLSLRGGRGSFALLAMTGSVLGRIDKGTLTLTDPDPMNGGA